MDVVVLRESRAHEGGVTLLDLPAEVILLVLSAVGPGDVLSIRKTCNILHGVTYDRTLWTEMYLGLSCQARYALPGPPATEIFAPLTRAEVESYVLSAYLTDRRWMLPRKPPNLLEVSGTTRSAESSMHSGFSILNMDVISDRWLVVLYQGDIVELWDLCPRSGNNTVGIAKAWKGPASTEESRAVCKTRYTIQGLGPCSMSAVAISEDRRSILLAAGSQVKTTMLRFSLMGERGGVLCDCLATFETPSPLYTLRAIDPTSQIVVYSHALSLCFVNWSTQKYCLVTSQEEGEELWSGINGVTFLISHHVLCVTTRSIEVYTLDFVEDLRRPISPLAQHNPLYLYNIGRREAIVQKHPIADATLRGVSFSEPRVTTSTETQQIVASFLAYDVLRGLFHFGVTLTLPRPSAHQGTHRQTPLDVSCALLAAHHMAQLIPLNDIVRSDTPTPRSGFTSGSRGFISACALGAQGKRGVWIERQRNNIGRTVLGFAAADYRTDLRVLLDGEPGANLEADAGSTAAIDGRCLYEVHNSYDLRDDLTHCAFSEVTGKIILGTRRGQLLLL